MEAAGTPTPTKLALVAVLAATALSLVALRSASDGGRIEARPAGLVLSALTALFALRVVGQLVVLARGPRFLPPMGDWNLLPYRLLLPIQIVLLALMTLVSVDLLGPGEPIAGPWPSFGRAAVAFSFAYASAMAIRYAVRMARRPRERWFGGTIPIVFHLVLAAFVYVLGRFHGA